jgi:excisionase family DNA binding protein
MSTPDRLHDDLPLPVKTAYRVNEVARALGVSKQTVYAAINEQRLVAYRPSLRSTRIPRENLLVWFESIRIDPYA